MITGTPEGLLLQLAAVGEVRSRSASRNDSAEPRTPLAVPGSFVMKAHLTLLGLVVSLPILAASVIVSGASVTSDVYIRSGRSNLNK